MKVSVSPKWLGHPVGRYRDRSVGSMKFAHIRKFKKGNIYKTMIPNQTPESVAVS